MPSPVAEPVRGTDAVAALADQLPRFIRLIHALKAQHAATAGRDQAALVLLYPLHRLGALRQSELADLVHADPSTVSRHVTVLADRGLVRRIADESDGRASRLVLTDDGIAALDAMRAEREAYFRRVTSDWSETDLDTLTPLFERLLDDIATTLPGEALPTIRTADQ